MTNPRKLTTMEKRAERFVRILKTYADDGSPITLRVEWKKSRMYGMCPSIADTEGNKCAYASGCGYDKLSAVLAKALATLAPGIRKLGGAGESAVMAAARVTGYELAPHYRDKHVDAYEFRKLAQAEGGAL